ncbi:MAG: ABC transporter permease [Planctomycetota bacterium]
MKLFAHIASLEARTKFTYRVDFWINALVGFTVDMVVVWFLWDAIFTATGDETIGDRNFDQMVLYYIAVMLLGRFVRGEDVQGTVSSDIYEGGLNRYLVFPTGYRVFKYAQGLGKQAPKLVQIMLFGACAVPLLGVAAEVHITLAQVCMCVVSLITASLLHYLITFPLQSVAFWADNVWSLIVGHRLIAQILGGYMLPLSVFPDWSQGALALLPFRFYFDFPARVLLGDIGVGEWALGMAVAVGWCLFFAVIGNVVWKRGLYQYSGVGM